MALAKKCERLYDSLATANDERNRLYGILYSNYVRLGDLRKTFDEKRANQLLKDSERLAHRADKMRSEASDYEQQTP